ncbi:globin domain-containing protein [Streptomyces klenkii]|uniref:globin domain-containing protein n=1 Tax=Streptomyces klenkii TaxID=1420899 RepID=UPI003F4BCABE
MDLVDDTQNLVRFCGHLGCDHRKFGTLPAHFPAVGESLLASLARYAGSAWTPDIAAAWTKAYGTVAQVMISAAEEDGAVRLPGVRRQPTGRATGIRPGADARTLAYPEFRGNGVMARAGDMIENPHLGMLFVDLTHHHVGLHINGAAHLDSDRDHPARPAVPRAGRRGPTGRASAGAVGPDCHGQPCFTLAGAVFQLLGMNVIM